MLVRSQTRSFSAVTNIEEWKVLDRYKKRRNHKDYPAKVYTRDPRLQLKFEKWDAEMRKKVAASKGPFFLGSEMRPFPLNPDFKPISPLTDFARETLYQTWCSDKSLWTPRKLAMKFCFSIERVKAIIKLKDHEKTLKNENILNPKRKLISSSNYVNKWEEIYSCTSSFVEKLLPELKIKCGAPVFFSVPENAPELTVEDAAKLLGKPIRSSPSFIAPQREAKMGTEPISLSESIPTEQTKIIRRDVYEAVSKFKWVFTDIDQNNKIKSVMVRDLGGILRTSTQAEKNEEIRFIKNVFTEKSPISKRGRLLFAK